MCEYTNKRNKKKGWGKRRGIKKEGSVKLVGNSNLDIKKLIYIGLIVCMSFLFIIGMLKVWNLTYGKNVKVIDDAESEIISTMSKELEDDKNIYEETKNGNKN